MVKRMLYRHTTVTTRNIEIGSWDRLAPMKSTYHSSLKLVTILLSTPNTHLPCYTHTLIPPELRHVGECTPTLQMSQLSEEQTSHLLRLGPLSWRFAS
jgi:hypothetical protein